MTGHPHEAPPPKSYAGHWAVLGLAMAAWAAWAWLPSRPLSPLPIRQAAGDGVDWFLLVRVPEVPSEELEAAAAPERLASWLHALRRAGFQPMRLSHALARLDRGQLLPRKTVVLLFQPGYRHTYERLGPVLEQQRWPAVWLASRSALRQADRRYLSGHALDTMERSGLWDIGWYEGTLDQEAVMVELPEGPSQRQTMRRMTLDLRTGHIALNHASHRNRLHRLAARTPWTAQELVDRLTAEAPVDGPAHLTARQIGPRLWGLAVETGASGERHPFNLGAPINARVASVAWPCTSGKNDLVLDLHLMARLGETWVLLRSNQSIGQAVRVGFTEQTIFVEQDHEGARTRLAEAPWPQGTTERVAATILLRGRRLHITVQDQPVLLLDSIRPPADPHGLVELVAYDRVRGAAGLHTASVVFVPITVKL